MFSAETCADGVQNQGEQGTDCGGACPICGRYILPQDGYEEYMIYNTNLISFNNLAFSI